MIMESSKTSAIEDNSLSTRRAQPHDNKDRTAKSMVSKMSNDQTDHEPPRIKSKKQKNYLNSAIHRPQSSHDHSVTIKGIDFSFLNPNIHNERASWGEVCSACWCHNPTGWIQIIAALIAILVCLYFFLLGNELMKTGTKVMAGCAAGYLLGGDQNPMSSLMVGILATVFTQSSGTVTTVVVTLTGSDILSVQNGIFIVLGANCGTCMTNTIVSLGHIGNREERGRAFAAATLHDMFNILTICIIFPLEVATSFLHHLTGGLVRGATTSAGDKWKGPVKKLLQPLSDRIIISNKNIIKATASGSSCDSFYPVVCTPGVTPTSSSCQKVGLIACSKTTGECPLFFTPGATKHEDEISGLIVVVIGMVILFTSMFAMTSIINRMLVGTPTRIIYKATNINSYVSIALGTLFTVFVQSSSIATSIWVPFAAIDIIGLQQVFPLTLGANCGTAIVTLLNALATEGIHGLQVSLAHLLFNIFGLFLWFPIPYIRHFPMYLATQLGLASMWWRGFPIVYLLSTYLFIPGILLGLSLLFWKDGLEYTILASFLTVIIVLGISFVCYSWWFGDLQAQIFLYIHNRQRHKAALDTFDKDTTEIRKTIAVLSKFTDLQTVSGFKNHEVTEEESNVCKDKEEEEEVDLPLADEMDIITSKLAKLIELTGITPDLFELGDEETGLAITADGNDNSDSICTSDSTKSVAKNGDGDSNAASCTKSSFSFLDLWDVIPLWYKILMTLFLIIYIVVVVMLFTNGSTKVCLIGGILLIVFLGMYTCWIKITRASLYQSWQDYNKRNIVQTTYHIELAQMKNDLYRLKNHCKGIKAPRKRRKSYEKSSL